MASICDLLRSFSTKNLGWMGRRKVACNNGLCQQRGTELTINRVHKDTAQKQKAETGVPLFSKLMISCYQQSTSPHKGRL